jgi:hypothetical protein
MNELQKANEEIKLLREVVKALSRQKKQMLVESIQYNASGVDLIVRNCEHEVRLGDLFGYARVTDIQAYGKHLEMLGQGMTGCVTLNRWPSLIVESVVEEDLDPVLQKWLKERDENAIRDAI